MRKERSQMIISTNKDADALQKEILAIQNSIAKIHSSDRYKKYLDLKNTLNAFSKQRLNIRDEINSQFTKISRPLGRYEYASSLEKDQKKVLSELSSEPIECNNDTEQGYRNYNTRKYLQGSYGRDHLGKRCYQGVILHN